MSLISFADLATLKNVSRQAIYDRKRRGFFDKAIVKHNGKEVLNSEIALQLWDKNDVYIAENTTKKQLKDKIDSLPADKIPDFAESKAKREFYLAETQAWAKISKLPQVRQVILEQRQQEIARLNKRSDTANILNIYK